MILSNSQILHGLFRYMERTILKYLKIQLDIDLKIILLNQ